MKLLVRFIILFSTLPLIAQNYSNQWIDYDQSYYSFPISSNGLYKISYQDLVDAKVPISTLNPSNIQIFARGKEVPLYIAGENDGVFNVTDYIEFYAEKNDGWLDSNLYQGINSQPNPYYSLINDTIFYFLTWNTNTNNLRFQEENSTDFSNYFKAPYVWKEKVTSYNDFYYDGEILIGGGTDPEYTSSEGWMDSPLTLGSSKTKTISTPNRYTAGPFVEFEATIAGASNWGLVSNGDHHLRISIGNQQIDRIFEGYEVITINQSFSPSEIIGGNNNVLFESIDDRNSSVDRTALSYMKIIYPQTLSFSNNSYFEFLVDDGTNQNAQYLEILFFRGGSNPVLYDLDNRKKIKVVETLSNYKTIIPNGNGRKRCVIAAESDVLSISKLSKVGENGFFMDYKLLQNDTSFLIISQRELLTEASFYAAYRLSTNHSSMVADIEQLYLQYSYGVKKHPLAIRNFVEDIAERGSFPLSHIFLMGKSVAAKAHRKSSSGYTRNLVPTMGNPAADNLLIAGLGNTNLEPIVPLGRLSAKNGSEIDLYLDKVREYESAPPAKWMKRALHFAGGKSTFETNRHENYLERYAKEFQSTPLGGQTQLFRKSTSSPFQVTLSDSIRTLINEGVSLLTFFGHSTANGGFDISIDTPDKLKNQGRYHVLFANSCYAGNTHQNGSTSTSEQYVLERGKGAIGFIANGNLGLPSYLNTYSIAFYENLSVKNYGKSLAENMRLAVQDIQTSTISGPLKSVCLEMTLQGDPAIVLNAQQKVDYKVNESFTQIKPNEVTTDLDSFKVNLLLENIGKANTDSFVVQLIRKFPISGINDSIIFRKIGPVSYEKILDFTFPINSVNDIGVNEFTFLIDPLNSIEELSEFNNRLDFEILIRSGEIIPVYPYQFAIVGKQNPTLKASTAFAFEEEKTYRFEIDNTIEFNSPLKPTIDIQSKGGVIEWQPIQLQNMPDSSVYYWRVSKVPLPGEDFNWKASSFQYIPNESGWAQDDFDQFNDNDYLFIRQNKNNEEFEFVDNVKELSVKTIGSPTVSDRNRIFYAVDADIRERASCYSIPAFMIAILDSLTLDSWETPYNGENLQNDFGQSNVGPWCSPNRDRSEAVFNFNARDTNELFAMRDLLNDKIPDGSYIVVYNYLNINYTNINNIDSSILKAFNNLGSTTLNNLEDEFPFIITAKKGNKSSVVETSGNSKTDEIDLKRILVSSSTFGEMTSSKAGPSDNYRKLSYEFTSLENNSPDSLIVDLIGIDNSGKETVLFKSNKTRIDTLTSTFVNNQTYNELQLKFTTSDIANQTPVQLKRWQLSYDELADAALAPNVFFDINKDTLQQGEPLDMKFAIQNNSSTSMDSILIDIRILDARRNLKTINFPKTTPLLRDSQIIVNLSIPTNNLLGKNTLLIEINPEQQQNEQYYFNNLGQYDFYVLDDQLNPLLDVTFDGRHILNREIVSSTPRINISLRDDNEFLALDDTTSFSLFIRDPQGNEEALSYGSNGGYDLQFIPASLPENTARVIYTPKLEQDGIYRLRVQGSDKSGNLSGSQDYQVEFEVVNKSTVTRLLNYPNPFSTSTQFVFTLTGSEVPDQVLIQIMTITGKVVREIDENELGPIHIGNNITSFKWNGKDEFGDQLANGVYLYRVKMKLNGSSLEQRKTKIDQYFTKDFGKMYLLR